MMKTMMIQTTTIAKTINRKVSPQTTRVMVEEAEVEVEAETEEAAGENPMIQTTETTKADAGEKQNAGRKESLTKLSAVLPKHSSFLVKKKISLTSRNLTSSTAPIPENSLCSSSQLS